MVAVLAVAVVVAVVVAAVVEAPRRRSSDCSRYDGWLRSSLTRYLLAFFGMEWRVRWKGGTFSTERLSLAVTQA